MKFKERFKKYKPGVNNSTHLILAALFWTTIGTVLFMRGLYLLESFDSVWMVIPAACLGWLKSRFILDKTARKNIDRILKLQDGACLGAVFSVKTWGLVLMMSLLGVIIRHAPISQQIVGFLCIIIGFSLIFSSRYAWIAWRNNNSNA